MYKIGMQDQSNRYDLEELVKVFLPPGSYAFLNPAESEETDITLPGNIEEKDTLKQILYKSLSGITGYQPEWGILTGVRPVKIIQKLEEQGLLHNGIQSVMKDRYYLSEEKINLLQETLRTQLERTSSPTRPHGRPDPMAVGIYIGIPFCPTRCVYCSFPSNIANHEQIHAYLAALLQEIAFVSKALKSSGRYVESIYIGGGTPTHLGVEELELLLDTLTQRFDLRGTLDFTVEAGRPDTITEEKLICIKQHGADRISINPQSMNDRTLRLIGRSHTTEQIRQAFQMARKCGISVINADIIAGLPEESEEDFANTLEQIVTLRPENITVHTLALKRASKWKEQDGWSCFDKDKGDAVKRMIQTSREMLSRAGYRPYYLYRQKQMTGNLENVGYALPNTENLYNIRIMEERQTIIAMGAGGISKAYFSDEDRLERIANVSNYQIYIERIAEMIERKKSGIFDKLEEHHVD